MSKYIKTAPATFVLPEQFFVLTIWERSVSLCRTLRLLPTEQEVRCKRKEAAELPGYKPHNQSGNDRSLPDAGQQEGNRSRNHGNGYIKADFGEPEIRFPGVNHCPHEGLSRQHSHVRQDLQIDAEAQPKPSTTHPSTRSSSLTG